MNNFGELISFTWSVAEGKSRTVSGDEKWAYKEFAPSEKDRADRALMCVVIRDYSKKPPKPIGVLSVSSTEPGEFAKHEKEVIRFFAILLSRYKVPIATLEERRNDCL